MRAVIDLGTNTFHLMIATVNDAEIKVHFKVQIPVKIGEKGINSGYIHEQAYERAINALEEFKSILNIYSVKDVLVFGTSAIRDAANGKEFMDEVKQKFDLIIETISGESEAALIYEGVKRSFNMPVKPILIMDIGGGSVEFIIGNHEEIFWKKSYRLGAARLLERFHNHEPILEEEIIALNDYLRHELSELVKQMWDYEVGILAGSAGSFETIRDILRSDMQKIIPPFSGRSVMIDAREFNNLYQMIIGKDEKQRRTLTGLLDFRVDMIIVSLILIDHVIKNSGINQIIISEYALKEGMLFATN